MEYWANAVEVKSHVIANSDAKARCGGITP